MKSFERLTTESAIKT